jgi:hypothetical protein
VEGVQDVSADADKGGIMRQVIGDRKSENKKAGDGRFSS